MGYQVEPNVFSSQIVAPIDAAYLAGLFEGEGTVYLVARKGKGRHSHHFMADFSIANSNLDLLKRVRDLTGNGRIMLNKRPTSSNHKQVYVWQLAPRQIHHVAPQLLPYLFGKRRQVEIILRYFEIQKSGARADGMPRTRTEDIPEVLTLHAEMQRLNHRGMTEPELLAFSISDPDRGPRRLCQQEGCEDRAYRREEFCYKHFLLRRKPEIRNCEWCSQPMDCILPRKRFCTPRCQMKASYARRNTAREAGAERESV